MLEKEMMAIVASIQRLRSSTNISREEARKRFVTLLQQLESLKRKVQMSSLFVLTSTNFIIRNSLPFIK